MTSSVGDQTSQTPIGCRRPPSVAVDGRTTDLALTWRERVASFRTQANSPASCRPREQKQGDQIQKTPQRFASESRTLYSKEIDESNAFLLSSDARAAGGTQYQRAWHRPSTTALERARALDHANQKDSCHDHLNAKNQTGSRCRHDERSCPADTARLNAFQDPGRKILLEHLAHHIWMHLDCASRS